MKRLLTTIVLSLALAVGTAQAQQAQLKNPPFTGVWFGTVAGEEPELALFEHTSLTLLAYLKIGGTLLQGYGISYWSSYARVDLYDTQTGLLWGSAVIAHGPSGELYLYLIPEGGGGELHALLPLLDGDTLICL